MRPYKLVKETADRWTVHDGERQFDVAKANLRHSTVQKIKKHFADGGEVAADEFDLQRQGAGTVDPAAPGLLSNIFPLSNPQDRMVAPPDPAMRPAYDSAQGEMSGVPSPALAAATPAAPSVMPKEPSGIQAGINQEIAGEKARAKATSSGLAEQAAIQAKNAAKQEQDAAQLKTMIDTRQAKADAMFNDYMSSKVNPNRLWNDMSPSQKVAGSIAMILGGIGAGLTRGPNYGLEVIEKAIDRDIEAQKIDLGKKVNGLSHYMGETRDMVSASRLLKADHLDAVAAQMASAAAKSGSAAVLAEAQKNIGALRTQAVGLRQEGTLREFQIEQAKMGVERQHFETEALGHLLRGVSGGGGFPRQILELPAFKDWRERAVDLPDGSVGFADDKPAADKARDSMKSVANLRAKLGRFSELLKTGNPATFDRGRAQAERADILAEMGHLHELNRLTDVDLELFKNQVPDISDLIKPYAAQKLKALGNSIDDRVWAINQAVLHRPRKRP